MTHLESLPFSSLLCITRYKARVERDGKCNRERQHVGQYSLWRFARRVRWPRIRRVNVAYLYNYVTPLSLPDVFVPLIVVYVIAYILHHGCASSRTEISCYVKYFPNYQNGLTALAFRVLRNNKRTRVAL